MRRMYRMIQCSFWEDTKVIDDFTPEDRYFYLYLMTNPHTNLSGCYQVSVKQMGIECGYTEDVVRNLLLRMERTHDVIRYSHQTKEVLILNWSKYNWTKSEQMLKGVQTAIADIKNEQFKEYLIKKVEGIDTVYIPSADPMVSSNTNTITNATSNKKKKAEKPTIDEVKAYIQERGLNVDAQKFYDYYEAGNWTDAQGKKVKNWKQKLLAVWDKPDQRKKVPDFTKEAMKETEGDYEQIKKALFG